MLGFALLVSSDAAQASTLRLEPLGPGARWTHGYPSMRAERDGLEIQIVYRDTPDAMVTFDVHVTNRTAADVLLRPEESFLLEDSPKARPVDAIDPEATLLAIDRERARLDASETTRAGIDLAFGLLDLVTTVALPNDGETPEQATREHEESERDDADRKQHDEAYWRARRTLDLRRRDTAMTALRRATLAPGESTQGELRFPPRIGASPTTLFVAVGWEQFEFQFQPRWDAETGAPSTRPAKENIAWPRAAEEPMPRSRRQ